MQQALNQVVPKSSMPRGGVPVALGLLSAFLEPALSGLLSFIVYYYHLIVSFTVKLNEYQNRFMKIPGSGFINY